MGHEEVVGAGGNQIGRADTLKGQFAHEAPGHIQLSFRRGGDTEPPVASHRPADAAHPRERPATVEDGGKQVAPPLARRGHAPSRRRCQPVDQRPIAHAKLPGGERPAFRVVAGKEERKCARERRLIRLALTQRNAPFEPAPKPDATVGCGGDGHTARAGVSVAPGAPRPDQVAVGVIPGHISVPVELAVALEPDPLAVARVEPGRAAESSRDDGAAVRRRRDRGPVVPQIIRRARVSPVHGARPQ